MGGQACSVAGDWWLAEWARASNQGDLQCVGFGCHLVYYVGKCGEEVWEARCAALPATGGWRIGRARATKGTCSE